MSQGQPRDSVGGGAMTILLYTKANCPHCEAARALLAASGHAFEERDPFASSEALKELLLWSAVASVPTVVVNGQVLVGFDADRLQEMLDEPEPEPEPDDEYVPEELPPDDPA